MIEIEIEEKPISVMTWFSGKYSENGDEFGFLIRKKDNNSINAHVKDILWIDRIPKINDYVELLKIEDELKKIING